MNPKLDIEGTIISAKSPTFIIAEIGQNHQGDINKAKKLINIAKESGANCVKFQKTCISEKFNKQALEKPYLTPNSWGKTYGEHKNYLEFSEKEFLELQKYSKEAGILFTASAMDVISLRFLKKLKVPFIKIGSGDANNFLLIEEAASYNVPLVISTGMQNFETVKIIYSLVSKYHKNFALLHCISAYPTPLEDINLSVINLYKKEFPDVIVGYSGHELGVHITLSAVALGAKIIERHITENKIQKGSDHQCSLEPKELNQMCQMIRDFEIALGQPIKKIQKSEQTCYEKLGKTIVFTKDLKLGHKICETDLNIKVAEPKGIDGTKINEIFGKILTRDVKEDESIFWEYYE